MRQLRAEADRAALSDAPLALVGEDGSGRAVLARLSMSFRPGGASVRGVRGRG